LWQATERERSGRCRALRRKLARQLHDKVGTDVGPRERCQCSASGLAESPSFVGCRPVTGREPTSDKDPLAAVASLRLLHLLPTPVCSVCSAAISKQTRIPVRTSLPSPTVHTRCPTSRLRCDRCSPPRAPALTTLASVSLPVCAVGCRHPCYTFSPCNRRTNASLPVHIARVPQTIACPGVPIPNDLRPPPTSTPYSLPRALDTPLAASAFLFGYPAPW
jgi:hypothetical protein